MQVPTNAKLCIWDLIISKAKYDMNDVQLECVSGGKRQWEKQCSEAVKKANRMLGMIKRISSIDLKKQ